MTDKKRQYWDYARFANLAFSFGVTMTAAILLGLYGGMWLDRRLGTSPLFLVVGVLGGVGVGFRSILSELWILEKEPPQKNHGQDKIDPD
ncbi:AtpZ/AtpI family protein [Neomoorella humiferrea]|uniref:Putative F0F1-ATPase subunit n=1 Tax=Neomoorella humiferrea TaxID=676965 RepID=A0A2T0AKZ1_9FIRM|nr:AtpZ/AtpI family protein [Moorella humiferrea]PRR69259.1 putative F0F1-ATPase subunit [Moorella humiferrea]